jgi:hypothetical protein
MTIRPQLSSRVALFPLLLIVSFSLTAASARTPAEDQNDSSVEQPSKLPSPEQVQPDASAESSQNIPRQETKHSAQTNLEANSQSAQQPAVNATATVSSQSTQNSAASQTADEQTADQQSASPKNDRLFGVLPNYLTVENEAQVPALTSGGKFKLVAKNAFDPAVYPFIGFLALVGQAQNTEPQYGQGMVGYARRYGVSFGDATIGSFMTGAVFPSLFKQDPRYYQLVRGGFWHRSIYSVSRILITRSDSGQNQFNSSEIVGNLFAAGISNAYHPAQDRSLLNTLSIWGTDTGWDTMANLAQEFWPDVHQWLKKKFPHNTSHDNLEDSAYL